MVSLRRLMEMNGQGGHIAHPRLIVMQVKLSRTYFRYTARIQNDHDICRKKPLSVIANAVKGLGVLFAQIH